MPENPVPEKNNNPQKEQDSPENPKSPETVDSHSEKPAEQSAGPNPDEEQRNKPVEKFPVKSTQPDSLNIGHHSSAYKATGARLNRKVLVVMLVLLGLMLVPIIKQFLVPLVLAATFATLFYPLYQWFLKHFKHKKALCSVLTCLILILGVLIPAYILVHLVTLQTIELYTTAEPKIREVISRGEEGILGQLQDFKLVSWLRLSQIDWRSSLQDAAKSLGKILTAAFSRTSTGVLQLAANLAIMFFTMFYFFIDGEHIIRHLRYLSPLRNDYEDLIFSRFLLISRATVKGTFLVGLTQGAIGGITLLIFGINTWLLWGFIMVILSIIPMIGAWLVMVPAAIIQILLGNIWQGVGIAIVSTVVISNIDNLLRPRLVGKDAKMHDLLIFFSTLGGIAIFGVMGFIVGPVIVSLFITVLDIYGMEFKEELSSPYTN
ncbi:MAG: AI-2E family transporter [Chitinivibrionales bacterium]|nr:AI-2E family transporter [Chitinivibrionales bacterium]